MSATDVVSVEVPDIGDFTDVPVIEILVAPGDTVGVDDPLLTLESDKATMDVPAPFAGTVRDLRVTVGDRVSQGTVLLTIAPSEPGDGSSSRAARVASEGVPVEAAAPAAVSSAAEAEESSAPPPPPPPPAANGQRAPIYASPSVRRLAR